jgi:pimeloyl-ACP methyl ester carboxylesterase
MPVPVASGSRCRGPRIGVALGGLFALVACADPPTGTTAGSDLDPTARSAVALAPAPSFEATASPLVAAECPAGTTTASGALPGSGALYLICVPQAWNGSLIVYAHGYVNPFDPVAIQDDEVAGLKVSQIVTGLGYAFATTSYRNNGLIVFEAEQDLLRVVRTFQKLFGREDGHTIVAGVSEGALIAVLAAERHPQLFDGAFAACGPVGDFAAQLNYLNDFRVLFDFFFPGVIPGSVVAIPDAVIQAWLLPLAAPGSLQALVLAALAANPVATAQLLTAAGITLPPSPPPELIGGTVLRLLNYNILGTLDAQQQLAGQPFDNADRIYPSPVDNEAVPRFEADQSALSHIEAMLETDGKLPVPVVTIHNLFDPVVPYVQEALYAAKVQQAGAATLLTQIPGAQLASPFGHCTFTLAEVQGAFALLASQLTAEGLALR